MKLKVAVILLGLFCFSCLALADELKLASIEGLVEQKIGRYVLSRVYQRIGIDVEVFPMPGKRAQLALENGVVDGEVMRIYSYGKEVRGVVRVEPAYFFLDTTPFVMKDSGIRINSVSDLNKYRVAVVRGVKHMADMTAGLENVHVLDSTEQVIRFLEYGRADVALGNSLNWKYVLEKMGKDGLVPAGPPLAKLPLYHYLLPRYTSLAANVGGIIKSMEESGELDLLLNEAVGEVFEGLGENHGQH